MDHIKKLKAQVYIRISLVLIIISAGSVGIWHYLYVIVQLNTALAIIATSTTIIIACLILGEALTKVVLEPLNTLTRAILHVAPGHEQSPSTPPNLEAIHLGKELVNSLALQVYQLASLEKTLLSDSTHKQSLLQAVNIVSHLPLPMFVLNKQRVVTSASESAYEYTGTESTVLLGKALEDSVRLSFPNNFTLQAWMDDCQENSVTNTAFWERVRITLPDETVKQCDISAHYNRDNPSGTDFIITLFDRTERYNLDDDSLSFVAMAVHELRTPVTMLRGYIEVFEEELAEQLSDELKDFMHKMGVAAGQLTIFVNNILNVARIEQNQLMMRLRETEWPKNLNAILDDLQIRAQIKGMTIERHIDNDIPTVGIDSISIYEVVANLIDNAIKYSPGSKKIIVSSKVGKGGLIETTVEDFGVGMPASVTTNLFEKFYRNHRTQGKVGGTGLGLYLTKAIITAHDGHVWVQSKEGEGSTFGFSVVPYEQLNEELKGDDQKDIIRQSHGWVKNHSMYRR